MASLPDASPANFHDFLASQRIKTLHAYGTVNGMKHATNAIEKPHFNSVISGAGIRNAVRRHRQYKTKNKNIYHNRRPYEKKKRKNQNNHNFQKGSSYANIIANNPGIDTAPVTDTMKATLYGNMGGWQNSTKWSPAIQHRGLSGANSVLNINKKYANIANYKHDFKTLSRLRKPIYYDSLYHLNNHFK